MRFLIIRQKQEPLRTFCTKASIKLNPSPLLTVLIILLDELERTQVSKEYIWCSFLFLLGRFSLVIKSEHYKAYLVNTIFGYFSDFQNEAHNYSTKLMNSIWGRYNLHAPPAFQKNEEVSKLLPSTPNQSRYIH